MQNCTQTVYETSDIYLQPGGKAQKTSSCLEPFAPSLSTSSCRDACNFRRSQRLTCFSTCVPRFSATVNFAARRHRLDFRALKSQRAKQSRLSIATSSYRRQQPAAHHRQWDKKTKRHHLKQTITRRTCHFLHVSNGPIRAEILRLQHLVRRACRGGLSARQRVISSSCGQRFLRHRTAIT
jgi:hypothetical protein